MKATKLQIPYTSQMYEEDGQIVAVCPELSVSSFGDTREQALAALQEAVTLFLEECQSMGTLEFVLEEAGYRRDRLNAKRWRYREPIQINRLEVQFA